MILACQNINKAFGTNVILKDASFHIEEKEKEIVEGKIIKATDIEKYKKFYKYMPNYYDVRL